MNFDPRAYLAIALAEGKDAQKHGDRPHAKADECPHAGLGKACYLCRNEWADASSRSASPAMARSLVAVLELHHKTTASFDGGRIVREVCAACHHASQFGVAGQWPCETYRSITTELAKED